MNNMTPKSRWSITKRTSPNIIFTRMMLTVAITIVATMVLGVSEIGPITAPALPLTNAPVKAQTDAAPYSLLQQIDLGEGHACGLDLDGSVTCWGDDANGQVSGWDMPYADETFASISSGNFFTCGTRTDGSALCWGYPFKEDGSRHESDNRTFAAWENNPETGYSGWVDNPGDTVYFKPGTLSIGNYHACGIKTSGQIACWGKAGDDRLIVPKDSNDQTITDWLQVEAGWAQTCAVRADGSVVCWGRGTLGRADGPSHSGPFEKVTTAVYNGCALATDGSVDCWGAEHTFFDQYRDFLAPDPDARFNTIEMSTANDFWYGCGLLVGGEIHCWGVAADLSVFDSPDGQFESITVGAANVCALDSEGYAHCWGRTDDGLLTDPPSGQFRLVDGGLNYSCALRTSGEIVCWGADRFGLDTNNNPVSTGNLEAPSGTYQHFALGKNHGCAIDSSNTVTCWGGIDTSGNTQDWAMAPSGAFSTLDAGPDITCGVMTDGTLECWGASDHNRLTEPSGTFTAVAVGETHICAIKSDQTIECWGEELFFDREGDENPDDLDGKGNHTTTIPPSGSHRYTAITAGEGHTCAVRTDNKIVCWGYHADGRNLVPGSLSSSQGFSNVNFDAIATGGLTNCGILSSDGSLSCWNNEKRQYHPEAEILVQTGFTKIGAGPTHMLAIGGDGSLTTWGVANPSSVPKRFRQPSLLNVQLVSEVQFLEPGDILRFEALFDRPVVVDGTPQLSFMLDDATRYANYVGGNPSRTLYFEYVLTEEDGGKTRVSTESSILVFKPGSSIKDPETDGPTATAPIETSAPVTTISYNTARARIKRIEPTIRSVTVSGGDRVKLSVDIYGAQDIKNNGLADGIGFLWSDGDAGGTISGNGREVTYSAPDQSGTHTLSVATPFSACRAPATAEVRCEATFEIVIRRASAAVEAKAEPRNPAGSIPAILTDSDGNQYEVFTPEGGGTFTGATSSLKAGPGVVPNGEIVGLRIAEGDAASNVGKTYQRYRLGGNWYEVSAVDASNNTVSSYGLIDAVEMCVPFPDALRSDISGLALVVINADDSLTILASNVRITSSGTNVCGNLSSVPATVAVGTAGSPAPLPTATPETDDTSDLPDTGGVAPSSPMVVFWILIVGLFGIVVGGAMRRARRSSIK